MLLWSYLQNTNSNICEILTCMKHYKELLSGVEVGMNDSKVYEKSYTCIQNPSQRHKHRQWLQSNGAGSISVADDDDDDDDKSCLNSLNAKERCFTAFFFISFIIAYTGASFTKGKEIIPSLNALQQQLLNQCTNRPIMKTNY